MYDIYANKTINKQIHTHAMPQILQTTKCYYPMNSGMQASRENLPCGTRCIWLLPTEGPRWASRSERHIDEKPARCCRERLRVHASSANMPKSAAARLGRGIPELRVLESVSGQATNEMQGRKRPCEGRRTPPHANQHGIFHPLAVDGPLVAPPKQRSGLLGPRVSSCGGQRRAKHQWRTESRKS